MKNLIWWSCRILAILLVASGLVYFLCNLDSFDSLEQEVESARREVEELKLALEVDKNESMLEVATLLRARSSLRQEEEELKDNSIGDREEMEALERKFVQLNEDATSVEDELQQKRASLDELLASIRREEEKQSPVTVRKEELLAELEEQMQATALKALEFDQLNAEMKKHKLARKAASDNYYSSFETMAENVVLPENLFFGDEIEVEVESISPSGHGFFIRSGQENGLRREFCLFMQPDEFSELDPFFLKVTLAEERFAFLEAEDSELNFNDTLKLGEKLNLIRSGESDKDKDLELDLETELPYDPL